VRKKAPSGPVQVPRAYYGMVAADGAVAVDVVDVANGDHVIEIGETVKTLPSGLTPELWALDQRAPWQHFKPLVRIPLVRFDRPPEKYKQVELWWRLWNLGQIGEYQLPPSMEKDERVSWVFSNANGIAKAQWNLVRARLESKALNKVPGKDEDLQDDLDLHHDRIKGSSR
jgi:hypothetical protein